MIFLIFTVYVYLQLTVRAASQIAFVQDCMPLFTGELLSCENRQQYFILYRKGYLYCCVSNTVTFITKL